MEILGYMKLKNEGSPTLLTCSKMPFTVVSGVLFERINNDACLFLVLVSITCFVMKQFVMN
jgi:hypothetical protein